MNSVIVYKIKYTLYALDYLVPKDQSIATKHAIFAGPWTPGLIAPRDTARNKRNLRLYIVCDKKPRIGVKSTARLFPGGVQKRDFNGLLRFEVF